MQHVITAMVENRPGVLARVVGLISGRGFNIDSLNVAPTQDASVSRMTIQVIGDDRVLEQVNKQLNRLVDVIKVSDLTGESFVERELLLIKVAAPASKRDALKCLAELSKAQVVSLQADTAVLQFAGARDEVREFVELLKPFKILDMSRSGVIAVRKAVAEDNRGDEEQ